MLRKCKAATKRYHCDKQSLNKVLTFNLLVFAWLQFKGKLLSISIMGDFTAKQTPNSNITRAETWCEGHCFSIPVRRCQGLICAQFLAWVQWSSESASVKSQSHHWLQQLPTQTIKKPATK